MKAWEPDPASEAMEESMESANLPEEDRDEVRRFAEVLRRIGDKKQGKTLPPMPDGMKEWMLGEDQ